MLIKLTVVGLTIFLEISYFEYYNNDRVTNATNFSDMTILSETFSKNLYSISI